MSVNPLREPPEETTDLYPGLVVCDARVTGSITFGRSRLPVWCVTSLDREKDLARYGWTTERFMEFVYHLLNAARGDLGRLLLVLADVERRSEEQLEGGNDGWWTGRDRTAIANALRAALAHVEAP